MVKTVVEVTYDNVWYKVAKLINFNKSTNEWVAQFHVVGKKTSIRYMCTLNRC